MLTTLLIIGALLLLTAPSKTGSRASAVPAVATPATDLAAAPGVEVTRYGEVVYSPFYGDVGLQTAGAMQVSYAPTSEAQAAAAGAPVQEPVSTFSQPELSAAAEPAPVASAPVPAALMSLGIMADQPPAAKIAAEPPPDMAMLTASASSPVVTKPDPVPTPTAIVYVAASDVSQADTKLPLNVLPPELRTYSTKVVLTKYAGKA